MSKVTFEWDGDAGSFVSLAPATGEKVNESMNAKIRYRDESLGDVEVVEDFLPSPDQLAFREESVKVTISLSRSSVEFFKAKAEEYNTPYQKMIRRLLDSYVEKYKRPSNNGSRRIR